MLRQISARLARIHEARRIRSLPRVGSIATIPSRAESFAEVLPRILSQVDRLFVYFDRFPASLPVLEENSKITVFRAEECGNLHSSSRLLPLTFLNSPSVFLVFDDDILYPPDYVARLVEGLASRGGRALVGFHATRFKPLSQSYARNRIALNFKQRLRRDTEVDELGTGTCAFLSDVFSVDPRQFPYVDMDDIVLAIEAKWRALPRIALRRKAGWLPRHPKPQLECLWDRVLKDDSRETNLLAQFLQM
jgi:hypothetical protein